MDNLRSWSSATQWSEAPTITTSGLTNGDVYTYGSVPDLSYSCVSPVRTSCSSGTEIVSAGSWSVTVTATDSFNQTSTDTINYTVDPAPQTIIFSTSPPSPALYGESYTVAASGGASGNPVTFAPAAMSVCTLSGSTVTFTGVGTCTLVTNQAGNGNYYAAAPASQGFTVNPAPLKVTASSAMTIYGSQVPAVTPTYSGFVLSDTVASLKTQANCTTPAVQSSNAGSYTTSCSGASDVDYAISYVNGSVTIKPAPLSITASSPTIFYGQAIPAITPSYSGFVLGQTASALRAQPSCGTLPGLQL
jgi:hypothetical protein